MARKVLQAQEEVQTPVATEGQNPISTAGYNRLDLAEQYKTKSAVIRFLYGKGYKVGDIARFMDIRYQHARNVIKNPSKKQAEPAVSE